MAEHAGHGSVEWFRAQALVQDCLSAVHIQVSATSQVSCITFKICVIIACTMHAF